MKTQLDESENRENLGVAKIVRTWELSKS